MDINIMGSNRLALLNQWRISPEYIDICTKQKKECERLIHIAQQLYTNIDDIKASTERLVARTEMAVGGDIHRGAYCPSPILDIVIGNISRGRILKRSTSLRNISHQFQFDGDGFLLAAKSLGSNLPDTIEYIVHQGDRIYGLTVDPIYGLTYISEESYVEQKLVHYCYANLIREENRLWCLTLHSESYYYDDLGLISSDCVDYQAVINSFDFWHYDFERKNGYLSSYRAIEKPFDANQELLSSLPIYTVRLKRKA